MVLFGYIGQRQPRPKVLKTLVFCKVRKKPQGWEDIDELRMKGIGLFYPLAIFDFLYLRRRIAVKLLIEMK